ncbi:MAG: Copper-exporting P-type ATPase B [Methanosaeta sp. PtaU1.Bin028]|nr:MAG: Copper-exporting P-type ATPase B [Methanosaeta sp. PtaU1.Bin028]
MSRPWHALSVENATAELNSRLSGLEPEEAGLRLESYGRNELQRVAGPSAARILIRQLQNYLVLVLLAAAAISWISDEKTNALVVLGILIFISILGFVQEYRAERAMDALRKMVAPEADVIRAGRMITVDARDLVPGDIIYVEAGDLVPADARIIESATLETVEASLTGESAPLGKGTAPLAAATPLAERKNMLYLGTMVSCGNGRALVTATGRETELGRISGLIQQSEDEPPLKIRLEHLAKQLAVLVLVAASTVFLIQVARGYPILDTLIIAAALAVAGIPESLPFVVTLALAYGTQMMAGKGAIVRRLQAVETLGSTTVICTDKTGTLTRGEMTVREIKTKDRVEVTGSGYEPVGSFHRGGKEIDPSADQSLMATIETAVLCNNSDLEQGAEGWRVAGDPTEGALIVMAAKSGLLEKVRDNHVEVMEFPFSSDMMRMTTLHRGPYAMRVSMKGAVETVLDRCSGILGTDGLRPLNQVDRESIVQAAEEMSGRALRVLAFAYKEQSADEPRERGHMERDLIFTGLVGMMDPPRQEAASAIRVCQAAGIRPVMITGDHRLTAGAIARELGISDGQVIDGSDLDRMSDEELYQRVREVSAFARATAEHKVRIVGALKRWGHIVAMTGDGVNDAPALRASDIGVAMGRTGTDVSKEASDMIITDDNFATIVAAVEEGRRIYENIRKACSYLLSCTFAEVMVILVAVLAGLPVPLLALQILWINVVAEDFPAIGLAVEPARKDIMKARPRNPSEPLLSRSLLIYTLGVSSAIFLGSLGLFLHGCYIGDSLGYARTEAFASLGVAVMYNAYSSRSLHLSILHMNPRQNKKLLAGILASGLAVLAVIYLPVLQPIFETVPLSAESWIQIAATTSIVVIAAEVLKRILPGL